MGNGAKAQQKRERSAKNAPKDANSQLKVNAQAQSIKCNVCFSTFLCTTRAKQLEEHSMEKHSKKLGDCFTNY
ncbi:At2g23090 like protein, partial [Kickxella alabastrina]|uniref:At2g23090 like protein n=1 Tax=Kickxella alabastrina TaxID=61397 RepID=UPI00221FBCCA